LYPILHALEKAKYLRSEQEVIGGKVRKYYQISALGRKVFAQLQDKIRELTDEVLDEGTGKLPVAKPRRSVAK
jgi:DNA-binding PadR family transcriptional regulator